MKRKRLRTRKVQLVGTSNPTKARILTACHKVGIYTKPKMISEGALSSKWINQGLTRNV